MTDATRTFDSAFLSQLAQLLDARAQPNILEDISGPVVVIDATHLLSSELKPASGAAAGISDQPGGIAASELWAYSNQQTSGAGGAGQFSGVFYHIQSVGAGEAVTRFQIVELRFRPSIDADLRLFYVDTDFTQAEGDLNNLETNAQSVTTPSASNFGHVEGVIQTNTPGSFNAGGYSGMASRVHAVVLANQDYEFPLGPVALYSRALTAQTQALGFAVFGRATVTAITVTFKIIVRKLPA